MNEINVIENKMRQEITNFLLPIQTNRKVDETAFASLHGLSEKLEKALSKEELVPKSLLNELFVTIKILRAEAPTFENCNLLYGMANQLEYSFELILKGETREQRVPGVPRVV